MKRIFVLSGALLILCGSVHDAAAATEWSVGEGGNGHLYEVVLVTEGILWDDARAAAEAAGGYLAVVTSQAENDFIFSLADPIADLWDGSGINTLGPWLGGYQQESDGQWAWVTGEAFAYTNWGYHQPNGNGDYLNIYGLGSIHGADWNDYDDPLKGYVIEYVPEPATTALLALGGVFALRRRQTGRAHV